jgi:hypothetical protein
MTHDQAGVRQGTAAQVEAGFDDATPPRCPTAMPQQVLVFWTPRRALAASLHALRPLRRRAAGSPARADEA